MKFQRHPVVVRKGFDCTETGDHCEHAGKPGLNHGIHGDEFIFAVSTETASGRRFALTLLVFTSRYPDSVPKDRIRYRNGAPHGAGVDIHKQLAKGAARPEFHGGSDECEWIGGGRCASDGSCLVADEMYKAHGIQSDAPDVDLTQQPEALWLAMEELLVRWMPEEVQP